MAVAIAVDHVLQHRAPPDIDLPRAERAVRDLLGALGRDVADHGLRDTPRRVAAAYAELLSHEPVSLTTFPNEEGYDELVVVRDIPFHSLCMHHLLPFHGVAHVAYLPGERIVGLSKLARVVELHARELQLQERLTMQVANCLEEHLRPKGIGVVLEAEHLCMSLRGVQKAGTRTTTSALLGLMRDDARTRQEFPFARHGVRTACPATLTQAMRQTRTEPAGAAGGRTLGEWRRRRLLAAGFDGPLAAQLAQDGAVDLHELLVLLDRGCPPELAARILAPLDAQGPRR